MSEAAPVHVPKSRLQRQEVLNRKSAEGVAIDRTNAELDVIYRQVSAHLIAGEAPSEIAIGLGLKPGYVYDLVQRKTFQKIHKVACDEFYSDLKNKIRDHHLSMALRKTALASRGVEALGEAITAAEEHVKEFGGRAKPTMVRALTDSAVAAIDRDPAEKKRDRDATGTRVNATFTIAADKVGFFQQVISESGVDLSHVLRGFTKQNSAVDAQLLLPTTEVVEVTPSE